MKIIFNNKLYFYLTVFVVLFPVLPIFGRSAVVGIWTIGMLILCLKKGKIIREKSLPLLILIVSLYAFYVISMFYSYDKSTAFKLLFRRIPLLIFPVIFFLSPTIFETKTKNTLLNIFKYVLLTFVSSIIIYLLLTNIIPKIQLAKNPAVFIRQTIAKHSGLHPAYLSLFLVFVFVNIYLDLFNKRNKNSRIQKIFFIGQLLYIFSILMLLSSKMSIIALFIICVIVFFLKSRNKIKTLYFTILLVVFIFGLIYISPNTRYRFNNMIKAITTSEVIENNPDSERKNIYYSSLSLIKKNILFGCGIGDVDNELQKQYKLDEHYKAYKKEFNTHNQYLEIYLSAGIIPLIIFVFSLVISMTFALRKKEYKYFSFLLLISFSLLSENLLSRQAGVIFFAFFNSFFAFNITNTKRVYVNARFLTQKLSGVQRFAIEISKELKKNDDKIVFLSPVDIKKIYKENTLHVKKLKPFKSHIWEQITLPFFLSTEGNPLLINLGNTAPLFYKKKIITIHDLSFEHSPDWFDKKFVMFYKILIPNLCRNSDKILTVSEFSKKEIIKYYNIDTSKIKIVYNAFPKSLQNTKISNINLPDKYILTVCSFEPRKNLISLIEAFKKIKNRKLFLIIAGKFNTKVFNKSYSLYNYSNNDNIIIIENPNDCDLVKLYTNAISFVYIPHYEGFGLPIIEAMSFGCPCIISDIEVFKEIFGEAAFYVDQNNIDKIKETIEKMIANKEFRQRFIKLGLQIEKQYSFYESAKIITKITGKINTNE